MTAPQYNARRRYISTDNATHTTSSSPLPSLCLPCVHLEFSTPDIALSLKKSATFNSPTSPSHDEDPILNIPSLPKRSPTCPRALEDAVAAGERRVAEVLGVLDRSLSGLANFSAGCQDRLQAEDLPLPRFVLDAHVNERDVMDVDKTLNPSHSVPQVLPVTRKHHTSDSGIGSTVTGSEESNSRNDAARKLVDYRREISSTVCEIQSGINGSTVLNARSETGSQHALSEYACRQIQKHIILPILRESNLKDFHPLVTGIPYRVGRKEITCLRDLEKVLLWLAPKWSVSRKSFIEFCETSIQCLHTTVDYLSEPDQRRPTDRPYTNGYFLDLTEQVRQYAAMITASREGMAAGRRSAENDHIQDERLTLRGGLSQTGRPAELVRTKNGKSISLRTGEEVQAESSLTGPGLKRSISEEREEDIKRSMARRRKSAQAAVKDVQRCSECDKVFKRPCDLTKHEKTHSRPWKCSETSCKYHRYGWPTEKERDRHVNDKHSVTPCMFKCQFHPCPYESKRESNCKQHMEKAHGWAYVRSKNNGKAAKKAEMNGTPPTPQINTPGSYVFDAPSPDFAEASSSYDAHGGYRRAHSHSGSAAASDESNPRSVNGTPFMGLEETLGQMDPPFPWNGSYDAFNLAQQPGHTTVNLQLPWDATSVTEAPIVPPLFESSLALQDQDPLFGENFDWSNMNTDFASYNYQLITPACSVETKPFDAFSRNHSISVEQRPDDQVSSLSPGAQGNVMLYSPYSNDDISNDEGYDEFASDAGKPACDFALFDGPSQATSIIGGMGDGQMFQDLACIGPSPWPGRGTVLSQELGMNDFMQTDEE